MTASQPTPRPWQLHPGWCRFDQPTRLRVDRQARRPRRGVSRVRKQRRRAAECLEDVGTTVTSDYQRSPKSCGDLVPDLGEDLFREMALLIRRQEQAATVAVVEEDLFHCSSCFQRMLKYTNPEGRLSVWLEDTARPIWLRAGRATRGALPARARAVRLPPWTSSSRPPCSHWRGRFPTPLPVLKISLTRHEEPHPSRQRLATLFGKIGVLVVHALHAAQLVVQAHLGGCRGARPGHACALKSTGSWSSRSDASPCSH